MGTKKRMGVQQVVSIGMMGAISIVLGFFEIPLAFFAPWLKLDFAYVPMLLTGFSLGFFPGFAVLLLKNLIQVFQSNSMMVGQLADMMMGCAMLLPATLVYQRMRTRKGAILGMACGVLAMVVMGVITNRYILLPAFMGDSFAAFLSDNPGFLWVTMVPFNLVKGGSVSIITFFLYRHLAPFLRRGMKG